MDMNQHPKIGMEGFKRILRASRVTKKSVVIIGPPGCGKTALVTEEAKNSPLPPLYFDLGNQAREDAMLTAKVKDANGVETLVQIPLNVLKAACERGVTLIIDELTRCDRNKQALAMALMFDRRIGSFDLHPETVVVGMGNGTESAGTVSLNDALINRVGIYNYEPTRDEVRKKLAEQGPEGSTARTLLTKVSAYAGVRSEMLCIRPPEGTQDNGAQVPSMRAWTNGATMLAAMLDANEPMDEIALAMLGGFIGRETAAAFFAVIGNEHKLPTPEEIIANPTKAKQAPDGESAVAAIGIIKTVHGMGPKGIVAAWLYLGEFAKAHPDFAAAAAKDIIKRPPSTDKDAMDVFSRLCGKSAGATSRARS